MANKASIAELRKMQIKDLHGELRTQERLVSKLRLGVKLNKEKDSAKYKNEKKELARIQTILTEKQAEELLTEQVNSTVSALAKGAEDKTVSQKKQS
jgi:ribosomal protein L29